MCILRTRMDVNNLFALLLVNAILELSTPFLLGGTLNCFGHTCRHHSGGEERSGGDGSRTHDTSGGHGSRTHDTSGGHGSRTHNTSGGHGSRTHDTSGDIFGKKRNEPHIPYCIIDTSDGKLHGKCGENDDHFNTCQNDVVHSKCRCYDQSCIDGVSERYMMTYSCLNKFCHGTEHCHLRRHDHNIVSSCSTHRVLDSNEYCVNHDSITSHGCYCDTADCVQKTALHCLNVTCNPSQGCEIYRDNGQFAARCYSLDHCHNCIHRCNEPLKLDDQRGPCYCDSQACADRIEMPIVTTHAPTTDVPALQQLDPYSCVAAHCNKYEPFCNLFEINNNVEGRCIMFQAGKLCSPANDLSVHGGCYCSDSKCVSNALTDYNQKHTTATTLAPGYMCDKELCSSDMYCHIVNYEGAATARCFVIDTIKHCKSYADVEDEGCLCNNYNCSIRILTEFSLINPETTTTTPTTTATTTSTKTHTTTTNTPPSTTTTTTTHNTTPTTTQTTTTPTTTTLPTTQTVTPTTTLIATTPTTTQTTTSTTIPTTTTPTTTTPTTTTPTTTTTETATTVQAVVNSGPRTCHICGDTSLPVPCSSRQIGRDLSHTCKTGENYCMTDIVQDDQGNVDVFKRCVDLATCEKKWITESADLDYCKRYGVVKNPYAFSCHFCCTEDKCNSMLVPNTTTWYTKTN